MSIFKKQSAGEAPAQKKEALAPISAEAKKRNSRRGAFSAGMTVLAVVGVIVFNLLIAQLPDTATQFDMTNSKIYNITDTTVKYLADVNDDLVIHVLADKDSMDSRIVRFLSKYEDLSDHVSVEYTNPTVYPSVLTKYNCDTNTIVVTCDATGRQETISIDDIIGYDQMAYYYYNQYTETNFDAEGLLTSAIDSVLTNSSRKAYETTGHEETAMPISVTELMKKVHISDSSVNLLTDGGIPDDCDLLIFNDPTRDLADDELSMVLDFLSKGGQVVYNMAGQNLSLPNFEKLCATYGMTVADGMIADPQRSYQNNPYLIFPTVDNNVDAASGVFSDSTLLFYASRGMTVGTPARDSITVKPFLSTSESGIAVVDEANQATGTYALAAVATEAIDDSMTARLTVYGSDSLVNSNILQSFTNVSNTDLFMSSITCGFGDISSINIDPVSLSDPTNTITTGGIWAVLFIFVIPVAALVVGFVRWMRRRKL
ncbi:MAG: GldG family protein [Oscillibacter sp.]|jgi:ABC-2 type transport system permease protein|nr:GldG family protein [Oscillibacter sp.]